MKGRDRKLLRFNNINVIFSICGMGTVIILTILLNFLSPAAASDEDYIRLQLPNNLNKFSLVHDGELDTITVYEKEAIGGYLGSYNIILNSKREEIISAYDSDGFKVSENTRFRDDCFEEMSAFYRKKENHKYTVFFVLLKPKEMSSDTNASFIEESFFRLIPEKPAHFSFEWTVSVKGNLCSENPYADFEAAILDQLNSNRR